jgi:hypothetical protein
MDNIQRIHQHIDYIVVTKLQISFSWDDEYVKR